MKTPLMTLTAFLTGLLTGGLLIWLALTSREAADQAVDGEIAVKPKTRVHSAEARRVISPSTVLSQLREAKDPSLEFKGMGDNELKKSVAALLKEADPFKGLSYKEKSLFNEILEELAMRDADGTLDWIDGEYSGELRYYSYERLLKNRFGRDKPRQNLEFFVSRGFERAEVSKYAGALLMGSKDLGTDDAIFLLQKNIAPVKASSGTTVEFGDDFDFAAFAGEAVRLKLQDSGMGFSRFPSNLFKEWVKVDSHAAMEFYNQNYLSEKPVKLSFNGIEDLAEGYLAKVGHEDSLLWTREILTNPEIPAREQSEVINLLLKPGSEDGKLLGEIASGITDVDERVKFSGVVLDRAVYSSGKSCYLALSLFPDKGSRMAKLEQVLERKYMAKQLWENSGRLSEDLARLGHSQAEIDRIAEVLKEKGSAR